MSDLQSTTLPHGQLWQECDVPGCQTEPVCVQCLQCARHCTCPPPPTDAERQSAAERRAAKAAAEQAAREAAQAEYADWQATHVAGLIRTTSKPPQAEQDRIVWGDLVQFEAGWYHGGDCWRPGELDGQIIWTWSYGSALWYVADRETVDRWILARWEALVARLGEAQAAQHVLECWHDVPDGKVLDYDWYPRLVELLGQDALLAMAQGEPWYADPHGPGAWISSDPDRCRPSTRERAAEALGIEAVLVHRRSASQGDREALGIEPLHSVVYDAEDGEVIVEHEDRLYRLAGAQAAWSAQQAEDTAAEVESELWDLRYNQRLRRTGDGWVNAGWLSDGVCRRCCDQFCMVLAAHAEVPAIGRLLGRILDTAVRDSTGWWRPQVTATAVRSAATRSAGHLVRRTRYHLAWPDGSAEWADLDIEQRPDGRPGVARLYYVESDASWDAEAGDLDVLVQALGAAGRRDLQAKVARSGRATRLDQQDDTERWAVDWFNGTERTVEIRITTHLYRGDDADVEYEVEVR